MPPLRFIAILVPALAGLLLAGLLPRSQNEAVAAEASSSPRKEIRLVLQITVDGLRGDLLDRYRTGFGEGGFNRLLEGGHTFSNTHYSHGNTETIVGHATLATGATPAVHGMIGNAWYDRRSGELGYNIEDPNHLPLPTREHVVEGAQVDPAQKAARTKGRSPRAILVPTLGDTLSAFHGGKSKVFGVSGKDRSAVAMAGHTGKAFWFSTDSTDFVTTTYYYDDYPEWAAKWNGQRKAESYAGTKWELSSPPESYKLIDQDDRPYEVNLRGFGRTFPHAFGGLKEPLFPTQLLVSPVGDELLADFAKTLVENEGVGKDDVPDYLSVSFSGVDAVNHFFGPSSLENEETVRRLDRTLADFFSFIDGAVGLEHTLVVLCADHGMAEMPEYMTSLGYVAGRLEPDEIVAGANIAGEKLGIEKPLKLFYRPYVYLDHEKITAAGVEPEKVAREVAEAIGDIEGIAIAAPTADLGNWSADPAIALVRNNHHPERSGDIYVAQRPYWFLFDKGPVACMHGSPWKYDTHVPLIFFGPGISAAKSSRLIRPADVAPTLARLLGLHPPGGATGNAIPELLGIQ